MSEDGKDCVPIVCTYTQKILEDGFCEECPLYFHQNEVEPGECLLKVCTELQIVSLEALCVDCPEYERGQGREELGVAQICTPDNCNDR